MPPSRSLPFANALIGPDFEPTGPCEIVVEDGRITAVRRLDADPGGRRLLAMPALADGHNHARPLSATSFGAGMKPLETWLPSLAAMPGVDPFLAASAAFGRALRGGCVGTMVHLTRPMGLCPLPEEARAVARAARDVGVSIGFAIGMRDRNPLVYGDADAVLTGLTPAMRTKAERYWLAPPPTPQRYLEMVDEVADAVAGHPHVDVQYGPNGVQWCSDSFLAAIAEASANTGRRVHMHLLETEPQRIWADRTYPRGIVRHLADIGLLSPRLTLAHCVWTRPDELELIAEYGARIAVNPSSNLHLSSGIAKADTMMAKGIPLTLGLDGCAFDEDDDALREMRLFRLLNGGRSFCPTMSAADVLRAACVAGRDAIGMASGGILEAGAPADLLVLDLDALDRDALMPLDVRHFLFSRARKEAIVEIISDGRTVLRDGRPTGVDLDAVEGELRRLYREALPGTTDIRETFAALEPRVAAFYRGCC